MGVFFRFDKDGLIQVAKLPFSNTISEEEFEKKSKFIDEEIFFSKYTKEKEKLKEQLDEVKFISNQRISRLGLVMQFLLTICSISSANIHRISFSVSVRFADLLDTLLSMMPDRVNKV